MELDAILRERDRKRGRMRTLFFPALNRFVRNEPGVAAAAEVASTRMTPARDVALIGVRHAERETINVDLAGEREVKNVFVAII